MQHGLRELLAQRMYGLCCGYEDLNDHQALRRDVLMQTAVVRVEPLASVPTFSRLENPACPALSALVPTLDSVTALERRIVEMFHSELIASRRASAPRSSIRSGSSSGSSAS